MVVSCLAVTVVPENMEEKILLRVFFQLIVITFMYHEVSAVDDDKFCDENLFKNNSTVHKFFTKEVNTYDFVLLERYKSLFCCARGFTDIEWYKDGQLITESNCSHPYTFCHMKKRKQVLYSKGVNMSDAGNYTCKVINGTNTSSRVINLKILPDKYMGPSEITVPPTDQYAQIGENARFYCEAYIGGGKKDASEVVWINLNTPNKFPATLDGRRNVTDIIRASDAIMGEYLSFTPVRKEDYGKYACKITNGDPPKLFNVSLIEGDDPLHTKYRESYKIAVTCIIAFTVILIVVAITYTQWHLEIHLFMKDHFGKLEDDDKEYDVFVCYDQADADFALGVLVPTLETKYHYKCFAYERDSIAGDWIPEIYTAKIKASRRFLMVLSPALALNNWCTYALYIAIEAMLNLHSKIICVVLQEIPWDELEQPDNVPSDRTLQHVLRVVRKVQWEPVSKRKASTVLKACSHIFNISNSSHSEESLSNRPTILRGSKEDLIHLRNQTNCEGGSPRFWKSLRVHLPRMRLIHKTHKTTQF